MKKPIYSNRLDHIFKSISGSSESELNKFKGNINSLDAEYLKFKPQSLTHFSFYKSDKKSPSRNSIINHVKERNKRGKNVISFENLKLILSQKQKTSVSKENKNLLELSFESELNENEQIPNYNNYSKNKSKQESQSIIYNKINKSENFPNLDKTLKKVQTISPAVIKNNSMSKTTQIFKRKTRNISNNFYTLNSLNKPTEELGEPTQVIKNFVSMSTEVDSMTKHKSSLNSFNTFTNIKASEAGASSHTTSKFRTPYKMKNNDDNKVSLTSSVKFLDDEDLKKVNRFSESNIIENLIKDETSIENKRMEKYKKLMSRSILKGTKSLKEMIENPNNSLDQSMEQKPKYSKLQIFKSSVALNRFLISDFLIGEKGNYSEASKKKIKITSKFYEQKANKVKNKAERIKQTFDLKTFGQTEINGHGIVTNEYSDSGNQKFSEFSFNTFLKEKKRKLKEKLAEKARKLGDLIQNLSGSYEEQDSEDFISSYYNRNNLERVIRVRNIVKKGHDIERDNVGLNEIQKIKNERAEGDKHLLSILKSVGPPSFMKTKFRLSTIEKYKNVSGRYFGC